MFNMPKRKKTQLTIIPIIITLIILSSILLWQQTQTNFSIIKEKNSPFYGDFENFYYGSKNPELTKSMEHYPPISLIISKPFTINPTTYYAFWVILIFLITPLTIFYFTKNPYNLLFYFSFSFPFVLDTSGFMSQAVLTILIIPIIYLKKTYQKIPIILIAGLTHSFGIQLFILILFLQQLQKLKLTKFFPFCAGSIGQNIAPAIIKVKSILSQTQYEFLLFITKQCNLIFIIIATKELITNKKHYLLITFLLLTLSGFVFGTRIWLTAGVIILIGFSDYVFKCKNKKLKKILIAYGIIFIIINLYSWYITKLGILTNSC